MRSVGSCRTRASGQSCVTVACKDQAISATQKLLEEQSMSMNGWLDQLRFASERDHCSVKKVADLHELEATRESLYTFGGSEESVRRVGRRFLPYFRSCKHVLDLGCG